MATKKRTLSAAGRKKIAEAQRKRWAEKNLPAAVIPSAENLTFRQAQSPVLQQNAEENDAAARQRLAVEIGRLQNVVRAHEVCIEDDRETIADYVGILKRELAYHKLRVEEITRDLRLNCIEV